MKIYIPLCAFICNKYSIFQTREMTAMDTWMLICMIFVGLAKFEYAMQLKIQFGDSSKIRDASAKENKIKPEKRCQRIDRYSFVTFLLAYMLIIGVYVYIYN